MESSTVNPKNRYCFCFKLTNCQYLFLPLNRPVSRRIRQSTTSRTMFHLPTEILEQIFTFLSLAELLPVRQTCSRFRDIIGTCSALRNKFDLTINWHHLREATSGGPPPASSVHFVLAELVDVFWWWPVFADSICRLSLESCEFSVEILRYTGNLKELTLKHVKLSGGFVGDFELEKLESLTLSCANCEIFEALEGIIRKPLVKIDFDFYKVAVETQLKMMEFVEARQDKLKDLSLMPVRYIEGRLFQLTKPNLKRLSIRECEHFEADQLLTFLQLQPNLEDLNLERIDIGQATIQKLPQFLPKLKRIELKLCNSIAFSIPPLSNTLEHLQLVGRNLDFTNCALPTLKTLHIRCLSTTGLNKLPSQSPNLKSLTIECCRFDSFSQLFSTVTTLKSLETLRLTSVRWDVDDDQLHPEPTPNLNLTRLVLKSSTTMTGGAVCGMFRLFPGLRQVGLYFMECVDDAVVWELCRTVTGLAALVLMNCRTTGEAAKVIERCCAELRYLEVRESWEVEKEEMERFKDVMEARGTKVINRSTD